MKLFYKNIAYIFVAFSFFASANAIAESGFSDLDESTRLIISERGWDQVKSGEVAVFTKRLQGQAIKACKLVIDIKAGRDQIEELILNEKRMAEWLMMLRSAVEINTDETGEYWYVDLNAPFPIKDRDAVLKYSSHQSSSSSEVFIEGVGVSGYVESKDKFVRMKSLTLSWHLQPLKNEEGDLTRVTLYAHVDLNGGVPDWFANQLVSVSPRLSMKKFKKIVEGL